MATLTACVDQLLVPRGGVIENAMFREWCVLYMPEFSVFVQLIKVVWISHKCGNVNRSLHVLANRAVSRPFRRAFKCAYFWPFLAS